MKKLSKKDIKSMIFRIVCLLIVIGVFWYVTVKIWPVIGALSDDAKREVFRKQIADEGFLGVLVMIGLQILQIVVAIIPGQPMEILAGALYGTFGGMIVALIGIFLGTALIFFLVRQYGIKFIELFFKEEEIEKIRNSKFFKNPAKFELLMLIIFAIPMLPKDIFVYIGALSPVRPKRFMAIATFGRIPGLFLTVYAGNKLSEGNLEIVVILIAAVLIFGLIGYFILDRLDEKSSKQKIKS